MGLVKDFKSEGDREPTYIAIGMHNHLYRNLQGWRSYMSF
jgi:hypothetical protein